MKIIRSYAGKGLNSGGMLRIRSFGFILFLVIVFMFTTGFGGVVSAATNITTCHELSSDGETYYLTADIINSSTSKCINITANNITLDCQGHLIDGNDSAKYGIYIYRSSPQTTNISIKNCIVTDWATANIYLENADGNNITDVTSNSSPSNGIYLDSSSSNTITNITANSNGGFGIFLSSSSSNTFTDITANYNGFGIFLSSSSSNTFTDITANSNNYGIHLGFSFSNTFTDITANSNSLYGIHLDSSSSNTLTNITANSNTWDGIYLSSSSSNTLTNITANSNSDYGIRIYANSDNNTIANSTISNNTDAGLYLDEDSSNDPENNTIYNCLFNNSVNVKIDDGISNPNYFNTTKQLGTRIYTNYYTYVGGNFYAKPSGTGYSETCTDSNRDGFCDNALNLSSGTSVAYDYLPLSTVVTKTITNCSVLNEPGVTYYLINDIINSTTSYCMDITAENITLDCQGHTIDGVDTDFTAGVATNSHNTVKNCIITDWFYGIGILNNSLINNVTANSNMVGIYLVGDNNTLTDITANYNDYGIANEIEPISMITMTNITTNYNMVGIFFYGDNSTFTDITANYNWLEGIYFAGYGNTLTNITANSNTWYGIVLYSSSSNTITNSNLKENYFVDFVVYATSDSECNNKVENITGSNNLPILYYNSSVTLSDMQLSELILCNADYSNIDNVTINGSQSLGNNMLLLVITDHSNISNIYSSNNYDGIDLYSSSSNTLTNITANSNSWVGIYLGSSSSNTFTDITANSNSDYGIIIYANSDNNTIANSTISNNTDAGLYLEEYSSDDPENNTIYNCLFNNSVNVKIDDGISNPNYFNTTKQLGTRIYSNGNYIGGNYYTNSTGNGYSDICNDTDHDGFCDNPLNLSNGTSVAWDYLPLSDEYPTGNYISSCTTLNESGAIYYLTADIINSSTSKCINITANNVVLDCQGHLIDGDDNLGKYGIYIYRDSEQTTNITVKNCIVTDWDSANIYLENASGNNITDVTSSSSPSNGIVLFSSSSNTLSNITANSNIFGIVLDSSDSNTLTNITANSNYYGIYLDSSFSNTLTNITANSNWAGIDLYSSSSNTVTNSNLKENYFVDFDIYASSDSECNNKIENITGSNNLPILYYNSSVTLSDMQLSELILCNADYSNIDNITINGSQSLGNNMLLLMRTDHSNISNVYSSNNLEGIDLYSSSSNTVTNITANSNSGTGIYFESSSSNIFTDITANSNTYYGIHLFYSSSNTLSNITANSNSDYGIKICCNSDNNIIANSTISNNTDAGLYLEESGSYDPEYNKIYNCLFNNSVNVEIDSGIVGENYFNTTKQLGTRIYTNGNYIGGNYWTNSTGNGYSDTCTDSDKDGFCDNPLNLSYGTSVAWDYLPLSDEYPTGNYISSCTTLNESGAIYYLTADIINSSTSKCINITANNVVLDCQGHLIDGDDSAGYGIYIYRSSPQTTNISIKNCIVTDWATANIYLENADGNNITDVTSNSGPSNGIYLYSSDSNTLTNITANSNSGFGILLFFSFSNTLTDITTNSNRFGIYLVFSFSNTLTDITANYNGEEGIVLYSSSSNTVTNSNLKENYFVDFVVYATSDSECNNKVENITGSNNLPILYYNSSVTLSDMQLSELILCNADYSNIDNITINGSQSLGNNMLLLVITDHSNISSVYSSDNYDGIDLYFSSSNTLTNITANSNSWVGIFLGSSFSNTLTNITANSNTWDGIHLKASSSNTFTDITANSNTWDGIYLKASSSNTFTDITTDSNSDYGIVIYNNSDNNIIANSTISNNTNAGLYLEEDGSDDPEYNKIYNCLFNNSVNVKIDSGISNPNYFNTTKQLGTRIYSNGNYIGGNYWTNSTGNGYSDTCNDTDHDGFCDNALNLSYGTSVAWDYLPLSDEYNQAPAVILNSPGNATYINKNYTLLNWTCTDPDGDNMTAYVYGDNSTATTLINTTTNCQNGSSYTFNWTGLNETTYYWKVNCTDSGGLSNVSDVYEFTVDLTKPSVTINLPENGMVTNDNTPLLNASASDENNISMMWYQVDGYNESWPMFHHDLNHTGYIASPTHVMDDILWTFSESKAFYSSPSIANGKVFFISCDDKTIYVLNESTGGVIWNYTITQIPPLRTVATVFSGVVFVRADNEFNFDDMIYALNESTGTQIWNKTYGNDGLYSGSFTSPTIVDDTIFVGSEDFKLYALFTSNGSEIWNYPTGGRVYSSPAVSDGIVFVGSDDYKIYALNETTGAHIWDYTTGGYVRSSPAVADGIVFVGSDDYKIYALNETTGAHIWDYTTGGYVRSSPAVADGIVFVGSDDYKIYALNSSSGAHIWNYTTGGAIKSSPAVADGIAYIGSTDKKIYALNASTGALIWNYTTEGNYIRSSPAIADGMLFVASYNGKLYAFTTIYRNSSSFETVLSTLSDGQHYVTAYAKDPAGNINSSTSYFTVDTTPPNITIINPENNTNLSAGTTWTWINISTDENAVCRYNLTNSSFDYSQGVNFTNTGGQNHSFNYSGLQDGQTYTLYYKCNDSAGNINPSSVMHVFGVNSTYYISNCSTLDIAGATYYLTADIINSSTSKCINITANNVVLDCQGHKVDGNDVADYGVYINRSSSQTTNITVKNCVVTDWDSANIYLENADGNNITDVTSNSSPSNGIYLYSSSSNTLTNITANSNSWAGILLYSSDSNTVTNITANSNSYYGIDLYSSFSNTVTNITANSNSWAGILLYSSDSNTVTNITANSNSDYGIYLYSSDFNTLTNITANSNTWAGINLDHSSSNTITNSILKENSVDFDIYASSDSECNNKIENVTGSNNLPILYYNSSVNLSDMQLSELILCNADYSNIDNVTINGSQSLGNNMLLLMRTDYSNISNVYSSDNYEGIYLYSSSSNTLSDITANSNAWAGIYLESSDSNTVTNITANSNSYYGICLYSSSSSNTLTNITANSNSWAGILLYSSDSNTVTNITANSNSYYGICLYSSSSNTVTNITANSNSYYGILLYSSFSNTITNITANSNSYYGILLYSSFSNTITNSTLKENSRYDFYIYATSDSECNNKVENITGSNNLPILYYNSSVTLSDMQLSELILCNADYSNIDNITINGSQSLGNNMLLLVITDHSNISSVYSSDNYDGIDLYFSSSNTLTNITANSNTWYGIYLSSSSSNTLTDITANSNTLEGIYLKASSSNTFTDITTDSNSDYGIVIYNNSDNNIIANSTISNNTNAGLYLEEDGSDDPEYNKIYNCLFNNSVNVKIDSGIAGENYFNTTKQLGTRIYSNGNYIGGNYWTNSTGNGYSDTCTDSDKDGFCDNPLNLSYGTSVAWDYLPLSDEYSTGNYISSCTTLNESGAIYYLTADIINSSTSKCINITANNVTLDCQGHLIDGNDLADYGIYISRDSQQTTNITIKNCVVTDWDSANVYLKYANGNTIINVTSNSSPDNGLFLRSSNSNTISNSTANSNNYGLYLYSSDSNTFIYITTNSNNEKGIHLYSSSSNTLTNITANSNGDGIFLDSSSSNTFTDITANSNNGEGIFLGYSSSNTFTDITANSNSDYGIKIFANSDNNIIANSTISNNTDAGLYLHESGSNDPEYNKIYNCLFNNSVNVEIDSSIAGENYFNTTKQLGTRIYSNGNYIGGNYWTNSTGNGYSDTCNDTDHDGFCDNPLNLSNGTSVAWDYLPLSDEYPTGNYISSCTTLNESGAIYYLTADIINSSTSKCINITANNVTLDCQGHLIDGDDSAMYGIYIYRDSQQTTNITVKNCIVTDWSSANIYLENADGNNITDVTSNSSPSNGIYLYSSSSNTLTNITANYNGKGILLVFSSSNTLTNITANYNDEEGIYLVFPSSNTFTDITANYNGKEGIYLQSSSSNTLTDITANSNTWYGIYLSLSSSNTFTDITTNYNGREGIVLDSSSSNTFTDITANSNTWYGIYLSLSSSNTFTDITTNSNTWYGIFLSSSSSNTLSNITTNSNSDYGIRIYANSDNNTIANSTISNNTDAGLYLDKYSSYDPENNTIYNCLFNNSVNVKIDSGISNPNYFNTTKQLGTRIYSNGNYIGGNYWTNSTGNGYSDTCNDTDHDGFCDNPLNLSNGTSVAWDYLPLSDEYVGAVYFSINLNSPPNQTTTNDPTPDFNFTVSGSSATYNCTLFINNTGYGTNSSTLNNTPTIITANSSLSDGTYNWYINCSAGENTTKSEVREITIDTIPPTTTDDAPSGWQSSAFNITLTCSDNGSGCNLTQYRIDGGSWQNGTTVEITTDGNHTVEYNSTDNVGNTETTNTVYAALDTTPPTTSATAVKDDGSSYTFNTWTNSTYVNVTLSCDDGSGAGCDVTQYCTDTDNTCTPNLTYSIPVQISTGGVSYIRFRSNDTAGNLETTKNRTIKISVWFSITLNSPPNQTTTNDPTPDFNFTVSGSSATYNCTLFINNTGYGTNSSTLNNTPTIITANSSLSDGTYNWYINCSAGENTTKSEVREITITTPTTTTITSTSTSTSTSITTIPGTTTTTSTSTTTITITSTTTTSTTTTLGTTTTTTIWPCDLPGDYPTCGEVTLEEVVDFINLWSQGQADLEDVVNLINAWAEGPVCELPGDYPPCGEITLEEVVDFINLWSQGQADLEDVVNLINAWAGS